MPPPIAITACSLLTPLDNSRQTTWSALLAGDTIRTRVAIADELLPGDAALDRSLRLALAATRRLGPIRPATGLYCGTSKGPVSVFLDSLAQLDQSLPLTQLQAEQIACGVGAMGPFLQQHLHLAGPVHTSVAACASGLHALHRAAKAIERGECERALVVAADASLHPLFNASFQRLGVLSPPNPDGSPRCTPFSDKGEGFFLIEAAAALLLEARPTDPSTIHAWLEETWIGGDGTNLIAVDPHTHSLRAGLSRLAENAPDLPFIHAHATGTTHDAFELAAIRASLGETVPVFSHKQSLGHSLGAAGLLAVALSALSHRHGTTPTRLPVAPGRQSLTIAQGFGGHLAVVRLRGA